MQLSELITVAPRYTRAINLERDAATPGAIDGYTVTITAREFLNRLAQSLIAPAGHRAWTLTGPYGSGKSAFALYLANLFSPSTAAGNKLARSILKEQQPETYQLLFGGGAKARVSKEGFCPILISGAPEPLLGALLRACCRDLRPFYATSGRPPAALKELEGYRDAYQEDRTAVSQTDVVEALARVIQHLQESGKARGVLLIIDELGKFLEYGARDQESGDIYVLQQLAEATARFNPTGFLLVTILHQSFERYAADLRPSVREEWAKVQGRFEDAAFQEPPEQLFSLISSAIKHGNHKFISALKKQAREQAEEAIKLGLLPRGMSKAEFVEAAEHCAPLHPVAVLALVRLSRKFGQNQRSLFSFLTSREPHGFANFLQQEIDEDGAPCFTLSDLYDYVAEALGSGVGVGEGATRWAEVQSSLDKAAQSPPAELALIKSIGLLSAVGAYGGLKPSREVLQFAVAMPARAFQRAHRSLLQNSLIVERKHSDTVALWGGSDIDIEERLREADRRVAEGTSLAQKVNQLWSPRPLVAKRHSFQTGTLRYFSVRFSDMASFSKSLEVPGDADGLLLYCLPGTKSDFESLVELAQGSKVREQLEVLIAIPREVNALREAIRELELLQWVRTNTPALQGDAVARRELRTRLAAVEERIGVELQRLFSPDGQSGQSTLWFHHGIRQEIPTARTLANFLSAICQQVYPATPVLRNELVNRRHLSTAAAAARRNLIDAMIKNGGEQRLGFVGTPPEIAIYASILEHTKIHRPEGTGYSFGEPSGDDGLTAVWKGVKEFFKHCELQRHSVKELFDLLQRPPYGLKMGIIPILFCAAALAHDTEIAFYQDGAFVPEVTVEVYDRLIRSPEKFELRRYRVEGVRREVYRLMAQLFGKEGGPDSEHLVSILKPLYRFFNRLPQYTKQTRNISPTATAIKEALFSSKDPDILLFSDLPRACGVEPFTATEAVVEDRLNIFFGLLKGALIELQRAYDDLLSELQSLLFKAFNFAEGDARERIRVRAAGLVDHCVEPRLKAFALQLQDDHANEAAWIEAVATIVVGKEPRLWSDTDRARYEVTLADLVRSFRRIEALVFEESARLEQGRKPEHILRISVSDRHSHDLEAVVVVEPQDSSKYAQAVVRLDELLEQLKLADNPELALAALSSVSQKYLSELTDSGQSKGKINKGRAEKKVRHGK
ncbi:MAG: hypothetical protein JOZ96_11570 [Acidobacteria bacterium]|nr:hypothetical protein [Acidobacteriota bacterium]